MSMIWHIFKKDWKLLWKFVLGVAGIHFASATTQYALDHLNPGQTIITLNQYLITGRILAMAFLIAAVVHEEAIPGVRQDWLVRPIKRRDLLLAKLLFVIVMVHTPILLADMAQELVNGIPFSQSLGAALVLNLYIFIGGSLPLLAFASLTRNLAEAVIGGTVLFFCLSTLIQLLFSDRLHAGPTMWTGLRWIADWTRIAVYLLGASAILAVQYFRRKTIASRWLAAGVALMWLVSQFVPWQFAFALERKLSAHPGAGAAITASFEPGLGKFRLPLGMGRNANERGRDEASTAYLPLHVTGLPDNAVLNGDRAEVRLMANDGRVLYQGRADDLQIRNQNRSAPARFTIGSSTIGLVREIGPEDTLLPSDGRILAYQGISLKRALYQRIKDQPLRLEIDYSWTLLQGSSATIPATGGDQWIPGVGHCKTKVDDDWDDVSLSCMQVGHPVTCGSVFLEHVPSGRRNPTLFRCMPNYDPFIFNGPDSILRFGVSVHFRDLTGLAKYPVDASQIPESRLVLHTYEPQDHFSGRVVIPEVRLSDWESLEHEMTELNR